MRHSELVIIETVSACGDRPQEYGGFRQYTTAYHFPEPYQPFYTVSYIVPEVQPVKTLSDTYSARLQFPVGQSTLLPGFGNNAQVLAEVDKVVRNIQTDTLLTVKRITVKGYASPEGNSASNQRLSQARAQAFVDYLHHRHNYRSADNLISAQGMGEDWDGLRQRVEKAHLDDRDAILSAIAYNTDNDRRDAAVKALSGGRTWRTLLDNYFPELRRNEYTIEYDVRGFNAQEAKSYVWTRPQLLSLNEFFLVAGLYDPASKEYKDVFDIAARVYPDSPAAQFNTGAMEVENGAYDSAVNRLSRFDTPEAWNNLGVAYWHKGESDQSQVYFRKAADAGLEEAKINLEQYNRWSIERDE